MEGGGGGAELEGEGDFVVCDFALEFGDGVVGERVAHCKGNGEFRCEQGYTVVFLYGNVRNSDVHGGHSLSQFGLENGDGCGIGLVRWVDADPGVRGLAVAA